MNAPLRLIFFYLISILVLAAGLYSEFRLNDKAKLPFEIYSEDGKVYSYSDYKEIHKGDRIERLDNMPVSSMQEVEFIADSKLHGEKISIVFSDKNNSSKVTECTLIEYYIDDFFIIITLVIGLSFWMSGVYVITATPIDKTAKILWLILITFALAILTPPGHFGRDDLPGYIIRALRPLSYIWGSVFFLHFSLIFPTPFLKKQKLIIAFLYATGALLSLAIIFTLLPAMTELNYTYLKLYHNLWTVTQIFLLMSIIASTLILPFKYKRYKSNNEKAQLEWIFWGAALGASPYILFLLIPGILGSKPLFKEEIVLSFLILIPVSFAIAVIRYRLFDIEVIIKRSIVYSVLITIVIFLYLGIIYLLSNFASSFMGDDAKFLNVLTAILIALIFNPLKDRVKHFVDSAFYREKYFFDEAISRITTGMKESETLNVLGKFLVEEISTLFPVNSIAILLKTSGGERLRMLDQKNFDEFTKNIFELNVDNLNSKLNHPFASTSKIDRRVAFDDSLETELNRWNINLVIPLTLGSNEIIGAIAMGDKLSELKYSLADVDLLTAIASPAALAVKRIQLQEKLFFEELEKTKHKELSELKSFFVAAVSHDLKTPLSSIKIFSELLRNEKISKEKSIEYLEIIEGETGRLGRMINNVLDYARIEKGIKKYSMEKVDLNDIVKDVLNLMSYEFIMKKFEIEKNISETTLYIKGNMDAINSMIENLISNSLKYSDKMKYLKVSASKKNSIVELKIEDKGIGISEDNLKEIFNPFFRGTIAGSNNISGAGLGLSIVKHVADAHEAVIEVNSKISEGTMFKIKFQEYKNES